MFQSKKPSKILTGKKFGMLLALSLLLLSLVLTGCTTESAGEILTKTHNVSEDFTQIQVDCAECNIRILPSQDGSVKVVCKEREKYPHSVSVRNNQLIIEEPNRTELFNIFALGSSHTEVCVYLPQSTAKNCSIELESASGNIELSKELSFRDGDLAGASGNITCASAFAGELSISSASGDIAFSGSTCKELEVDCASGNITLSDTEAEKEISLNNASGKIKANNVSCKEFSADSASGSVVLENVLCSEELGCETASGKITLSRCDAARYDLESSSGNIEGTLLSPMSFRAESLSGRVDVPNTEGGTCKISTDSGNIHMEIVD